MAIRARAQTQQQTPIKLLLLSYASPGQRFGVKVEVEKLQGWHPPKDGGVSGRTTIQNANLASAKARAVLRIIHCLIFLCEHRLDAGGPALATTARARGLDWGSTAYPYHQARSRYPLLFISVGASDLVVSRTASGSESRGLYPHRGIGTGVRSGLLTRIAAKESVSWWVPTKS